MWGLIRTILEALDFLLCATRHVLGHLVIKDSKFRLSQFGTPAEKSKKREVRNGKTVPNLSIFDSLFDGERICACRSAAQCGGANCQPAGLLESNRQTGIQAEGFFLARGHAIIIAVHHRKAER